MDDGSVSRAVVLRVLQAHGIDLSDSKGDNPFTLTTLAKRKGPKTTTQIHALPDPVRRRMVSYLSRKYGVPIHHFYNENMAPRKK